MMVERDKWWTYSDRKINDGLFSEIFLLSFDQLGLRYVEELLGEPSLRGTIAISKA